MDIHRCRFVDYSPAAVSALAFSHKSDAKKHSPKQLRAAVGRADGSIEIWNPRNGGAQWILENQIYGGKGQTVEGVVYAQDPEYGIRLFSIGGSTYLTEWDAQRGIPLENHDCNAGVIWSCAINESQNRIAVGCEDGSVVVVNITGGPGIMEHEAILQRQQSRVLSLIWINDNMIIGGCADGRIRCWSYDAEEQNKGRLIQTLRVDKSKVEMTLVWTLLALPESGQFVSGDSTGSIKIWELKHLVLQQSFAVHDADVLCLVGDGAGKFISAGVDRKMINFTLTSSKWVNASNRLLHGNDIRAMASYKSLDADLLISGGVERVVLVNSIDNFQGSIPLKLPFKLLEGPVILNRAKRLLVMWQANTAKIWRLESSKTKKLVAKLTLADADNIVSCSVSENGRYLAVARLSTIRLFELLDLGDKLQVAKVPSQLLENADGAQFIRFVDREQLILWGDIDNELKSVKFNTQDDALDEDSLSEFDESQPIVSYEMPDTGRYTSVAIQNSLVALSSFDGSIDLLDTTTTTGRRLVHMNDIPTAINFTPRGTLLVGTLAPKLYEFNPTAKGVNLYTEWSKHNSELMPAEFESLKGEIYGVFECNDRFWLYGANWLCFFDINSDFSASAAADLTFTSSPARKRSANGSFVGDDTADTTINQIDPTSFWSTDNYKSLLLANALSDSELVIVERPVEEMPSDPAFRVSRIAGL